MLKIIKDASEGKDTNDNSTFSVEIKAYAKMLYMLVDEDTGKRKFINTEIRNKLHSEFGKSPSLVTIGNWSKKWEKELEVREAILGGNASELIRYRFETDKYVNKDTVIKAVVNQIKVNLVLQLKRMGTYHGIEDDILSKLTNKDGDGAYTRALPEDIKFTDIQKGVVESNKSYINNLEKLEKWFSISEDKKSEPIIETYKDSIWEFEPVDIEEFFESKEFLGELSDTFYPCVKEDVKAIFYGNPRKLLEKRRYKEVIFKEAFGTGKSSCKLTTVINSKTGKITTIGELIDKGIRSFDTWGLNPDTLQIDKVRVTDVLKTGTGELYRLKLASGRFIEATDIHQFYSDSGWKRLQDFDNKDFIAIPRQLGDTNNKTWLTDDDIYFIGCYLSDGSFRHNRKLTKSSNETLMIRIEDTAKNNQVRVARGSYRGGWKDVVFNAGIEQYFIKLGLKDQSDKEVYSHEKYIPDSIMRLSNEKLKVFVNSMINTDGWLEVRVNNAKNKSPQVSLGYCSTSELMIDQLMIIFQRLGFVARKRTKIPKIKGKEYRKAYEINLWGKQAYELLMVIGPLLGKEELYNKALSVCKGIKWNVNVDLVPFTHKDTLAYNRKQNKYKYRDFKRIYGVKKEVYYSRDKLQRLRDDFQDEGLSKLADSGVFWDRVESVEKLPGVHDVYDCVVDTHHHNFIANGIITHNSVRAGLISTYIIYLILCLRDPAKYFKLLPGSKITVTNVSVSHKQAKDVVFSKIKTYVDKSSWFRDHGYMYDPKNKLELRFDPADSAKIDPNKIYKNVYAIPGSSSEYAALGYDVICAIIDEATAYGVENDKDKAETIYETLKARVSSRFPNNSMIVMAGNPHHVEDFLENRIRDAKDQKDIYIINNRSIWEAKMPDYEGDWFYFDYGKMKEVDEVERGKQNVIRVPAPYYDEFKNAPEMSVRNLAGISLEAISRFYSNVEKIDDMFINSGRLNPVKEINGVEVTFEKWFKPKNKGFHAVHVDIGLTNDALGLGLGHINDYQRGLPFFYTDCILRLKGSQTEPNILADVRKIIYQLTDLGFNIKYVSLDGYQSTDFIQILNRKGYEAYQLSVDKKMGPYINLRQATYEERLNCHHEDHLKHELKTLENVNNKKVDHPLKGSKDMADALCGVVTSLIEKVPVESIMSDSDSSNQRGTSGKGSKEIKVRTPEEIFEDRLNEIGSK